MIEKVKKILIASLLITSSAYADSSDYLYESRSLVGFEGGYSAFDVKDVGNNIKREESSAVGGIKIGAETSNIRMFLSFRNAFIDDYDYAYMYGVELQYLFNMSDAVNFYIGANIGRVSFRFNEYAATNITRDFTTEYMGGDIGFNWHMTKTVDLELGARLMSLPDPDHILNGEKYTFDDITMGYMSIIFKYQMD